MGSHFSLNKTKILAMVISSHTVWPHIIHFGFIFYYDSPFAHSLLISWLLLEDTSQLSLHTYFYFLEQTSQGLLLTLSYLYSNFLFSEVVNSLWLLFLCVFVFLSIMLITIKCDVQFITCFISVFPTRKLAPKRQEFLHFAQCYFPRL